MMVKLLDLPVDIDRPSIGTSQNLRRFSANFRFTSHFQNNVELYEEGAGGNDTMKTSLDN